MGKRGVALLTALGVAGVLVVLALALLSLFAVDHQGLRRQQDALQARWNARSAVQKLWDTGQLPPPDPQTGQRVWVFPSAGRCRVEEQPHGDLLLVGQCGSATSRWLCPQGDPARAYEIAPGEGSR